MTLKTNARLAGLTFLIYIAVGLTSINLSGIHSGGEDTAAKLQSIIANISLYRIDILLSLLCAGFAGVLAVTLFALTRHQDAELAMMGMICRLCEGFIIVIGPAISLALLWVAKESATQTGADFASSVALGGLLFKLGSRMGALAAMCFSMGSLFFSCLFLRARSIPRWLARLGVIASALLVVVLPFQFVGFIEWPAVNYVWLPMFLFEVPLGVWLLVKGVAAPTQS